MSDIVNLKRAKKTKARAEAEAIAAQNRATFGRSKADKAHAKSEQEAADRKLDGHKRHDDDSNI